MVTQSSHQFWIRLSFALVGLFGVGLAISGLLVALPAPAAGGTCGPGKASEAPIAALVDPISIGAGPEPPVTDTAARADWDAFVNECQTSADDRGLAALAILVLSFFVGVVGPMVWRRTRRTPGTSLQPMQPMPMPPIPMPPAQMQPIPMPPGPPTHPAMEHDWRL